MDKRKKKEDKPCRQLSESTKENLAGLTDILRAADRRIGRRRLAELAEVVSNPAAQKNLKQRINTYKEKQRKAAEADGF